MGNGEGGKRRKKEGRRQGALKEEEGEEQSNPYLLLALIPIYRLKRKLCEIQLTPDKEKERKGEQQEQDQDGGYLFPYICDSYSHSTLLLQPS